MATRTDPLRNFRFSLEFEGQEVAGFSEAAIAETTTDVVEYREGNDKASHVRKLSGLTKYGNITLKNGVTDSRYLWEWHKSIVDGQIADNRRRVAIIVKDEKGDPKARFVISDAWPVKYDPGDLNAKGNEVFIEVLELANEGIERAP